MRGDLCKKKADAKKLVAFICCKLLFENGCLNLDLKPNSFNSYGLDSKNDDEEIKEEDEEYKEKLEKVVKVEKKFKKNKEEILNYFYPIFNQNQLSGNFNVLNCDNERLFEVFLYEICFSNDFRLHIPEMKDKKLGIIHRNSDLHKISFTICPEFKNLSEKTIRIVCLKKIFLKPEDYYDFLLAHFFIGLCINNEDVRFYEMITGEKIKNNFVFNFTGNNSPLDYKENCNKNFSIFAFLNNDNNLDYELLQNIKNYVKFMSEYYKMINDNLFARPDKIKLAKNFEFIQLLKEKKQIDDLVVQSKFNYIFFNQFKKVSLIYKNM